MMNRIRRKIRCVFATFNNVWHTLIGLVNPRRLCQKYGYEIKFPINGHDDRSRLRKWFDTTSFGWYWTSTAYPFSEEDAQDKLRCNLYRGRLVLALITDFPYALFGYEWNKEWWSSIKNRYRIIFRIIKEGH